MNLGASRVVLRWRSITEVLDLACLVASSGFPRAMAWLSVAVLLPGYALALLLRHGFEWQWVWVWLAALTWASIAQGAFTIAVGRWMFSDDLSVRAILRAFLARFPSFLAAWLARTLYIAAGALVIVGSFLGLYHTLALYETSLLERVGPGQALRRSTQFVNALGARSFGMMLLLMVAQLFGVAAAEFLGHGLVDDVLQLGTPFPSAFTTGGSPYALFGLFAVAPYLAIARFLFYIDGRTRNDGWDIQVRFMAIANREAAVGGAS